MKKIGSEAFSGSRITKFCINPKNKYYASNNGCLYNRKSRELVAVRVKGGVARISSRVKVIPKELIDSNLALIKQSDIIIMQLEIPLEIVGYVKKIVFPNEIKKLSAYWRHSIPYLNKIKLVFTGESLPKLARANADFPMDSVVYVPKGRIKTYKKAYQRKYDDMDLKWEELK